MEFGITMFPTDRSVSPARVAVLVEQLGFESLFLPEHSHVPVDRSSPFPSGPEIPDDLYRFFDPLESLAAASAVTTTLVLGTSVLVVPDHDPIMLAKRVSTLDRLCGGRFVLGVGAGWNAAEMANHGADPEKRFTIMRERVEAMKLIWTREIAAYEGTCVRFTELYQWPKPLQQPHPPVFVGGAGPKVTDRVLRYGDGWMASGRHLDGAELRDRVRAFRVRCAEHGRGEVPVMLQQGRATPQAIEEYLDMGLARVTLRVDPGPEASVRAQLEGYAALVGRYKTR